MSNPWAIPLFGVGFLSIKRYTVARLLRRRMGFRSKAE
jgi:hypothetical protein